MEHLSIIQIVGFKNSGKTTLLTHLVKCLTGQGIEVAVVKHHGHGGAFEQPSKQTDSMQFLEAGAASSLVFDNSFIQLHMRQQENQLVKAIQLVQLAKPQIIFIEGMKAEHYPKLVLIRSLEDWEALKDLSNILAVITNNNILIEGVPVIERHNLNAITDFLYKWLDGEPNEAF